MDIDELAPHVGEARHLADVPAAVELLEARVAIRMHPALEACEVPGRAGALAVLREAAERGRRRRSRPGSLVAHVGPQPGRPRLAGAGRQHPHGRAVRMDGVAGQHVAADRLGQRLQERDGLADPVGERRAVEVDPFAGVDLGLAIQGGGGPHTC
jgi:hypothetical protein